MCSQPPLPIQMYSPPESSTPYERAIFNEYRWLVDRLEYLENEALELRDVFCQVRRCEITQTEFQRDTLIEQIDSVRAEIEMVNESIKTCAWIRREELVRTYERALAWIEEGDFREVKVELEGDSGEARKWECDNTEKRSLEANRGASLPHALEETSGDECNEFEETLGSIKPIDLGLNIEDFINYYSSCRLGSSVGTWLSRGTDQTVFEDLDDSIRMIADVLVTKAKDENNILINKD